MQRFYFIMPIQVGWNFRKGHGYFEPGDKVSRRGLDLLRVYGNSGGEPARHARQQCQRKFLFDIHKRSPCFVAFRR